ncbi:unnamed protein product [Merluccius merluccius]
MASREEKEKEEEKEEEEVEVTEEEVRARIAGVTRFLSVALRVANAHTVQFFTHDVWRRLVAVPPEEVLAAVGDVGDGRQGEPRRHPESETRGETAFGFCEETGRLVDVHALLAAARGHSLPGLGASVSRERLLRSLRAGSHAAAAALPHRTQSQEFLLEQSRPEEAAAMAERAAELDGGEFDVVFSAAHMLRQASLNEAAERQYERAANLRPDYPAALMNLGAILHLNGKLPEAEAKYLRALRLKPDDVITRSNLRKLWNIMERQGLRTKAVDHHGETGTQD